jgi:hypothetical protein
MRAAIIAFLLAASAALAGDDSPRGPICQPKRGNALLEILRPRTCAPATAVGGAVTLTTVTGDAIHVLPSILWWCYATADKPHRHS